MQNMNIDKLNILSLRFLNRLLETKSITRTGESLGLSQPHSSREVQKLRIALQDPLIVGTGVRANLTRKAHDIQPYVVSLMTTLSQTFAESTFVPETTKRSFTLATTDYGALTTFLEIYGIFSRLAPKAKITLLPWDNHTLDKLERGEIDIALYGEAHLPNDFHTKKLFNEDYVILYDAKNFKNEEITFEKLLEQKRIVPLYPEGRLMVADDLLHSFNAKTQNIILETPYFTSIPQIILGSSLVAALPKRLAIKLITATLQTFPMPNDSYNFDYWLIWHDCTHRDLGCRWLRSLFTYTSLEVKMPARGGH
jgi:DNA-binding transcriptional LysR family regulator